MKAVAFTHAYPITHEDALIDVHHPEPHPRHADLLVEIKAVSVNPVDTKVRRTAEPLGEERVLGFDAAGIVRGMGPDVRHFSIGDEVWYTGTSTAQVPTASFISWMSASSATSRVRSPSPTRRLCRSRR